MSAKTVHFLIYPGFELLDLSGPVSVFSSANGEAYAPGSSGHDGTYSIVVWSPTGGQVASSSGVAVDSRPVQSMSVGATDTVLVVGALRKALVAAMQNTALRGALTRSASDAERWGAVCSGTFVLAAAGLLKGRKVATHWLGADELRVRFPEVSVDGDSMYVCDETLWTSAGVTAGIDMALSMVSDDCGHATMMSVARMLNVYSHRPGYQSQFSATLKHQTRSDMGLSELLAWIDGNAHQSLRVAELAVRAGMSERSFYRKFTKATGTAPAKYVERVRLQRARRSLLAGMPLKRVCSETGFASEAHFRRSFSALFGMTPSAFRVLHQGSNHQDEGA